MFNQVKRNIFDALIAVIKNLEYTLINDVHLEKTKDVKFGHITTNIAFIIGAKYSKDPKIIAEEIVKKLSKKIELVESFSIGSGSFINFFLKPEVFEDFYKRLVEKQENFGRISQTEEQCMVEVVSANPNGSLHIGHLRNAIYTDTICNLLEFRGKQVCRVYLINDCGKQIRDIVYSVWVKYQHILFANKHADLINIPYNTQDAELCAQEIIKQKGSFWKTTESLENPIFFETIRSFVVEYFVENIKADLKKLNVNIDLWHSERQIATDSAMQLLLSRIKNYIYIKDGVVWFKTSFFFPDEKDNVIMKSNGDHTYFGQDLIYHLFKLNFLNSQGKIINVFASDHDGHIKRLQAFFMSIKEPKDRVIFKTLQLVRLESDSCKEVISKRHNNIISVKDLFKFLSYEEIRWFFIIKDISNELDIDIEKLKNKKYNNHIYYILYCYARIEQLFKKFIQIDVFDRPMKLDLLKENSEQELLNALLFFEELLDTSEKELKPYLLCNFLTKLAQDFHSFYENCGILNIENKNLSHQRLALCNAVKYIISVVFSILKISARTKI